MGAGLDLGEVLRVEFAGFLREATELGFDVGFIKFASTGVILPGDMPDGVSGGKGESGAGELIGSATADFSADFFAEAAHEFACETFDHLGAKTDAGRGEEIFDVGAVEFDAVGFADAINHFHLERDDGDAGEGFRKEFESAIEDGIFKNHPVVIGRSVRFWQKRGSANRGEREGVHRGLGGAGLGFAEIKKAAKCVEKILLVGSDVTARFADAERHLVGEEAVLRGGKIGNDGFERKFAHENLTRKNGKIFRSEFVGQTANLIAFGIGFFAIGKCSEEANSEESILAGSGG